MEVAVLTLAAIAWIGGDGATASAPQQAPQQAPELGRVRWSRSLAEARATASRAVLPVALLFQSVPGSASDRQFAEDALSHPLLVEVLETEFVPAVAVKNDPADAPLLERYGEEPTGGPVLRFLDAHGSDLVPRRADVVDAHGLARRLVEVIESLGRPVPGYLSLVVDETAPGPVERAWIEVPDLVQGEVRIASIPGVVSTRAAVLAGRDTVEVAFRPAALTFRDLLEQAARADAAAFVFASDEAQLDVARRVLRGRARKVDPDTDARVHEQQKPLLKRSHLRYLPLTPMQTMRINADLATNRDPARWLSPRQVRLALLLARGERLNPLLLADLEPPRDLDGIPAYERELLRRLRETAEGAAEH